MFKMVPLKRKCQDADIFCWLLSLLMKIETALFEVIKTNYSQDMKKRNGE